MLSYKELSLYPARFLAMTGYTVEEFQALLPYFQTRFATYVLTTRLVGEPRTQRAYCSYRNSPLPTIEDKQLFILVYLKQGTTQDVHAALFNMCQPKVNVWLHLLHLILNQALADAVSCQHEKQRRCRYPRNQRPWPSISMMGRNDLSHAPKTR